MHVTDQMNAKAGKKSLKGFIAQMISRNPPAATKPAITPSAANESGGGMAIPARAPLARMVSDVVARFGLTNEAFQQRAELQALRDQEAVVRAELAAARTEERRLETMVEFFCQGFGLRRQDIAGKSAAELAPMLEAAIHMQARERVNALGIPLF